MDLTPWQVQPAYAQCPPHCSRRSRVKFFAELFFKKAGRVQGRRPWPRAAARGIPHRKEAQEGVKGGTLAGGSPFSARYAGAISPQRKGKHPAPSGRGVLNKCVS